MPKTKCKVCDGSGDRHDGHCAYCGGTGEVSTSGDMIQRNIFLGEREYFVPVPVAEEIDRLQTLEARQRGCRICGGKVDLSNPEQPTAHVGPGGR